MKKVLSTVLALVMLITTITAMGVNAFAYSGNSGWCGDDAYWSFNSSTGTLTISGYGDMFEPDEDDDWEFGWRDFSDSIKTINIIDEVTSVSPWAFSFCTNLKTVNISAPVTDIGESAFYVCRKLSKVTLPKETKTIGKEVFGKCPALTSFTVPSTSKYLSVKDGVLYNKAKTTLIKFPTNKKVESFTVPNTVKTIRASAFDATGDFEICVGTSGLGTALKKVTIPDSVVTIGDYNFCGCGVLTTVKLGKNIETIGKACFSASNKLTSVTLPNSVKKVGGWSFSYCKNLNKLVLSTKTEKIPDGFTYNCPKLKKIFIPSSVKSISSYSLGAYFGSNGDKIYKGYKIYSKGNSAAVKYAKKYSNVTHVKVSVPKLAFKSVTAVSKGFKASWTKNTKMDGYQIQYATDSKFTKNKKTVTETDETKASKTIKNLTAKKKYYVRVRNYKRYAGAQVFSAWSGTKSVTTKN